MNESNKKLLLNSSIKFTELNQQVDFEDMFNSLPSFIFMKDKQGKYLDVNDLKLEKVGLKHVDDILGLTNFDLCLQEKEARVLHENDTEIIKTKSNKTFIETGTLSDGLFYKGLTFKSPIRLNSKKIIGVLGVSFLLGTENVNPNQLPHQKILPGLTPRQNNCLYYLVNYGMSIKEIAKELNLSPRTIEHHLEEVKFKLDCTTRSMLTRKYHEF